MHTQTLSRSQVLFENIPPELACCPQWVCWVHDPARGKVPINPHTGHFATVTAPETWGTLNDAKRLYEQGTVAGSWTTPAHAIAGIGFVFTNNDPFVGIDIDWYKCSSPEEHQLCQSILDNINSYTEVSPSGNGLHIICKAEIADSIKTKLIEIYPSGRYFTVTGNKLPECTSEILNCQNNVDVLFNYLTTSRNSKTASIAHTSEQLASLSRDEILSDEALLKQASEATNGQLFCALWNAEPTQRVGRKGSVQVSFDARVDASLAYGYPSQSEADQALMNMLWFYSLNDEQTVRLFKMSNLAQRKKTNRADYIQRTLSKAKDRTPPRVNIIYGNVPTEQQHPFDGPQPDNGANILAEDVSNGEWTDNLRDIPFPPGFAGELMRYLKSAVRYDNHGAVMLPVLSLLAAIVGRKYSVEGKQLNIYTCLVMDSADGKSEAVSILKTLLKRVALTMQAASNASQFMMSKPASSPALARDLDKSKLLSRLLFFDEMKEPLTSWANTRDSNKYALGQLLCEAYTSSNSTVEGTAYSDATKNIPELIRPCLTIYGLSTRDIYSFDFTEALSNGLLSRTTIYEEPALEQHTTDEVYVNVNSHLIEPSDALIRKLAEFCAIGLSKTTPEQVAHQIYVPDVPGMDDSKVNAAPYKVMVDEDAAAYFLLHEKKAKLKIKGIPSLHKRAVLIAKKYAAIVAVCLNDINPVITLELAKWAMRLVMVSVTQMDNKFYKGLDNDITIIGKEQVQRCERIKKVLYQFLAGEIKHSNFSIDKLQQLRALRYVPYVVVTANIGKTTKLWQVNKMSQFDKLYKEAISQLVQEGVVEEIKGVNYTDGTKLTTGIVYRVVE